MAKLATIARRTFLIGSAAVVGGVAFGVYKYRQPAPNPLLADLPQGATALTPYVRIDGQGVTLITPRAESLFGGVLGLSANFGFGDRQSTPVLIFVWGRQRIYPVRLTDVNIQEVEFNPNLNPTRVIAGISMQVLSGSNPFFIFTQAQRELLAATNLIAAPDLARSVFNLG